MSIRNLGYLFEPASVAVIGVSGMAGHVGTTVWRNLRSGRFAGPVLAVNPKYRALDGAPVVARVQDLDQVPELAVICTPAASVAGLIADLGALGTKAAVILSAGMSSAQKQQTSAAARPHLLRILGPNCIGILSPHLGLNASFAHTDALPGGLAFVSQSGALTTALLDWARSRGIGFSHFVSLGENLDVDFGDALDHLASDPKTRAILLYIESITSARKFMSAARAAARNKPVIVVKAGRSDKGQQAAASHTGALAGSDLVYDAAIARAGMLRVDTLQQLFLAAETLARFGENRTDTLTVLTNGGGAGVLAADAAAHMGVELADLAPATRAALDAVLPPSWSHGNPVDIIGDAPIGRYVQVLQLLESDPAAGAVLLLHAPTAIVPSADIARALLPLASSQPPRLMGCWLGEQSVRQARQCFQDANIASFNTPEQAVRAFSYGVTYRRNQAQLLQAPALLRTICTASGTAADKANAKALVDQALRDGSKMLSTAVVMALLEAYGIPVVGSRTVDASAAAAMQAAQALGFPVVLKILSDDISHKSGVGGVALNLESAHAVEVAARDMLERVRRLMPQARIQGFTVQHMVRRAHARELIVGASIDSVFGPVILFGQGGTAVEVVADRAVALPPLNATLALALIQRTRVSKLLQGFRDTPAVAMDALQAALVAVSELLADVAQIAELDINPLLADASGVIALDARIRLDAAAPAGEARFAILPYPAHLTESVVWKARQLTLRAIRPEDELQHRAFLKSLASGDVRPGLCFGRLHLEDTELARLTQIDYAREMAFVAVATEGDGAPEQTLGEVRAVTDPDNLAAEFCIAVRPGLRQGGLGRLLLKKLLLHVGARGTRQLGASVASTNTAMLALARELGFAVQPARDPGMQQLVLHMA